MMIWDLVQENAAVQAANLTVQDFNWLGVWFGGTRLKDQLQSTVYVKSSK